MAQTRGARATRTARGCAAALVICAVALSLPVWSQGGGPGSGTGGGGGRGGGRGGGQGGGQEGGAFEFDEARYDPDAKPSPDTVRCAVIGGMAFTTHMFSAVADLFEAEAEYKVVITEIGQRPVLDKAMREGRADLLTMHSGDITTNLVADGYGTNMRPWTRNDLVIMGPPSDPAGIRGMKSGVEAAKKIAAAKANFVDNRGNGPREVAHTLWEHARVNAVGDWVIQEETDTHLDLLGFAESHGAYIIVGRAPVVLGKLPRGNMEIMVEGDPLMRRPYIVMEANPLRCPDANVKGARAFADFLVSERVQTFLREYGKEMCGGVIPFYPIAPWDAGL